MKLQFSFSKLCDPGRDTLKKRNLLAIFIVNHGAQKWGSSGKCEEKYEKAKVLPMRLCSSCRKLWHCRFCCCCCCFILNHFFHFFQWRGDSSKNSFSTRFQCVKNNIIFFIVLIAVAFALCAQIEEMCCQFACCQRERRVLGAWS